jgi:hypothetical protein
MKTQPEKEGQANSGEKRFALPHHENATQDEQTAKP